MGEAEARFDMDHGVEDPATTPEGPVADMAVGVTGADGPPCRVVVLEGEEGEVGKS